MREQRKRLTGVVTSNKMDKTVVVTVTRKSRHPMYGKVITTDKKYMVHDEKNECDEGDKVEIIESRPLSRRKRWSLVSIVKRANN